MEKKMVIKGMMCGHCEAAAKKALEKIDTVNDAAVSYKDGTAIVKLNADTSDEILRKAIEDEGYEVVSIS